MKLIVIDPHITSKSPTMRAWLSALPYFSDLFESIELWASECEVEETAQIQWVRFSQIFPTWALHSIDFKRRVRSRLASLPESKNQLIQATGCLTKKADIRYMHFWNRAFLEECKKRPESLKLSVLNRFLTTLEARNEGKVSRELGSTNFWWVVSRSLAERIASESRSGEFRVLPNEYHPNRFHLGVRQEWRASMREKYGFQDDERILVFSAFGHFERKGLYQAVEAMDLLRQKAYKVRLLILGGTPATVDRFSKKMTARQKEGCVFAGLVSDIERHLVAADALIFPSHFEAFSLAEIEAAALGLRLYLTPHYGSEMILREPENGRLLPWDSAGMAQVLAEELDENMLHQSHTQLGEALNPNTFGLKIRELFEEAIDTKRQS